MIKKRPNVRSAEDLRTRAEEIFAEKDFQVPENFSSLSPRQVQNLWHELSVHQIELEMQNDELHRSQDELEAAHLRYFSLYNLAPVGYFTLNEKGLIVEANNTAAGLLGLTRGALARKPITRFIMKEDQDIFYLHRKNIEEPGEIHVCELRMMTRDQVSIWTRLQTTLVKAADGKVYHCTFSNISDRKKVETDLMNAIKEKEVLLREVHHRVKNNLQVVCSLLSLKSHRMTDKVMKDILNESYNRIRAIAIVHDKLYGTSNFAEIDLKDYIISLVTDLYSAYVSVSRSVNFHTDIEPVKIPLSVAVPCGLILNEIISNSLKYAFPKKTPVKQKPGISISIKLLPENNLQMKISDNGIGIPDNYDLSGSGSLGLYLVNILSVDQLNGKLIIKNENGTHFTITFNPWQK